MSNHLKKLPLKSALIFICIVVMLNAVYYINTRNILINDQEKKLSLLAENVKIAIEQSYLGEEFVEELLGLNLRTAALAAQFKMDQHIENVSNEELIMLSKLLMVDHISLFQRTASGDDIVVLRSSDPKEIGLSSKTWDSYWKAMNQLLDKPDHEVTETVGKSFPNYWTGPLDTSSSDPTFIDKWGYYYDGSTNYIINPYIHDTSFRKYQSITGADSTIKKIVSGQKEILEISVINPEVLLGTWNQDQAYPPPSSWYSERLVIHGNYKYRDPKETSFIKKAIDSQKAVYYVIEQDGKQIFKTFVPLSTLGAAYKQQQIPPVIELASDYSDIQNKLNLQCIHHS